MASQCSGGAEVAAYSSDDQITPFLPISKDGQPRFLFYRDVALQVIDNINCLDHLIFVTGDRASRLMATVFATDEKGVPEKPGICRPVGSGKPLAPVRTFELAVAATSNAGCDGKIYLFGAGRTAILLAKTNGR